MKSRTFHQVFGLALALLAGVHCRVDHSDSTTASLRAAERKDLSPSDTRNEGAISWTNLLYRMGVCHTPSETCPHSSSNSCGCPDCTRSKIPSNVLDYCNKVNEFVEKSNAEHNQEGDNSYSSQQSSSHGIKKSGGTYNQQNSGESTTYEEDAETYYAYDGDDDFHHSAAQKVLYDGGHVKPWALFLMGVTVVIVISAVYLNRKRKDDTEGLATDYKLAKSESPTSNGSKGLALNGCCGPTLTWNGEDDASAASSPSATNGSKAPRTSILSMVKKATGAPIQIVMRAPAPMDCCYSTPLGEPDVKMKNCHSF